jgi:hypothetical protein
LLHPLIGELQALDVCVLHDQDRPRISHELEDVLGRCRLRYQDVAWPENQPLPPAMGRLVFLEVGRERWNQALAVITCAQDLPDIMVVLMKPGAVIEGPDRLLARANLPATIWQLPGLEAAWLAIRCGFGVMWRPDKLSIGMAQHLHAFRAEVERWSPVTAELEQKHLFQAASAMDWEREYHVMVKRADDAAIQFRDLLEKYQSINGEYQGLSLAYEALQREYDALTAAFQQLSGEYAALTNAFQKISGEYDGLMREYAALAQHSGQLQKHYEDLDRVYRELDRAYKSLLTTT